MKIDIHVHTRKCKQGDKATRNVEPAQFRSAVLEANVGIIAITNHNVFDYPQYQALSACVDKEVQVWPGIEFDVKESGKNGHLIVIVSPVKAADFANIVTRLTKGFTPDDFVISLEEIVKNFDALGPVYIAHYHKAPKISDDNLNALAAATKHQSRIIKEVTNAISAGIYIAHGKPSIYGSDLHDWSKYKEDAVDLPELRLPVESFEQFCFLLDKTPGAIETLLHKKAYETITVTPFDDGIPISLKVYDDINVFFGSKGTGKSKILESIAQHYTNQGIDAEVHSPDEDLLDNLYQVKDRDINIDLEPFGVHYCTDEIKSLRSATEVDVTSIKLYVMHFASNVTNAKSKLLTLQNLVVEQETEPKRSFDEHHAATKQVADFVAFFQSNPVVSSTLSKNEFQDLKQRLVDLETRMISGRWDAFTNWKEIFLLNRCIKHVKNEVQRKTGKAALPTSPGFREYALNRIRIQRLAKTVLENASKSIPNSEEIVGVLGGEKGELSFRSEHRFHDGSSADASFHPAPGKKKGAQKQFVKALLDILKHAYDPSLFEHIAVLNDDELDDIKTVNELLLARKGYYLNGQLYKPSTGEKSMLLLHRELAQDKDIYLLDEPERSLGNDYINDVILPLIRDKAKFNKKVFIATHDANIAVRTLPYCTTYRRHGSQGYETFVGNPFTNDLIKIDDPSIRLDWKKISMKTLEGGQEAFGERGKIYGNP